MKFLHITFHFQFSETIEEILDKHEIRDYIRVPMVESNDRDGKHFGSQVFPGNSSLIQAQVPEEKVDDILSDLKRFREEKLSHQHLEALVLPVEQRLGSMD